MFVDINVKVAGKQVVITGPQIRTKEDATGVMLFHKETDSVIGLGETEENLKENYMEALKKLSVKELVKFDTRFSIQQKIDWKKAKGLYEEDEKNNTEKAWDFIKENFVFLYPFDLTDLQPKNIMYFIHLYVNKLAVEQIRPGFLGQILSTYWDRYAFNLTIEGYETLEPQVVKTFEAELIDNTKYGLFKVKALSINGKTLV